MKGKSLTGHLSMLGAWALAFGCAVGSDAFVLPWTEFLPKAGPLGTALGVVAGALVMAVIAWNYHYMINRRPGPGGVYAYASEVFGHDHGFLCGYFLGFAYLAIVWLDVTAFVGVVKYVLGDVVNFGFHYHIEGGDIYFGHILLALFAIAVTTAICCRRRLSGVVQIVMAVVFAVGILACFLSAAIGHEGGLETMRPGFSPTGGSVRFQLLNILTVSLWLFIGFESISNSSAEFRFPLWKSFRVMAVALVTSVVAYLLLTAIPVLVSAGGPGGWFAAVSGVTEPEFRAFDEAGRFFGRLGKAVVGLTLVGGIFTNLVGNTVAASRLTAAMADDGAMPAFLGGWNADGAPRNAVLAIAALAILLVPLGSAVIGVVVDISIIGGAIAYAYTSAAAFRTARAAGDRRTQATGLFGLVVSTAVIVVFVVPIFMLDFAMIATKSYLVLIGWGISGLMVFLAIFNRDTRRRFGRSSVVWISLFLMMLCLSNIWIWQSTHDTTAKAFDDIISRHDEMCPPDMRGGAADGHGHSHGDWRENLRCKQAFVTDSIVRNSFVQGGLNLFALALIFCLYRILRRREREMEREKAQAKSFFFSTVSHDIRTPLNAIIGFSEMLKVGFKTEAERDQAVDSILVSGRTLLGLVNDVLDLSKLESGKMEILPEPTDCRKLAQVVMDAFRVSGRNPGLELRCNVGDMPLLMLDPQRLRQIVFNLVGNAVKFTEKGHVELRISFARREGEDSGQFRIDVEDTGCGISEESRKVLGSAYVQVGSGVSRNGGTGLGLAICKQLAAAMGGRLEIASELGRGSTFSLVVPDVKFVSEAAAPEEAPVPARKEDDGKPSSVRRILLVDDSKMNLMVLTALLKHEGDFEVVTAMDGQEALDLLTAPGAKPFDFVFTDMWMPRLDGEGLIRAVRGNPALASLRVVAATADVECQGKYAEMGFDGILLKPITTEKLRKALQS
ncbi:MAG: amino acid permease [Kiritimatiellae bacterium]|nr:amino acid permease [Kiritimatiellia bacterium]